MRRNGSLFGEGFWGRGPSLDAVLQAHLQASISKIQAVVKIEELTDDFVKRIVKESLVEPVVLKPMTRELTTEEIDASCFPSNFCVMAGKSYPQQVATLSIPFEGDPALLRHHPGTGPLWLPVGDLYDHVIKWDVILFKYDEEHNPIKQDIERNLDGIKKMVERNNVLVERFNKELPARVEDAFCKKIDDLSKQLAFFDNLGIAATPQPDESVMAEVEVPVRRTRKEKIVQIVREQYVTIINQFPNVTQIKQDYTNAKEVHNE